MPRVQNHDLNRRIGAALRQVRVRRGCSLAAVAGDIGCSYQQLQKYEQGRNAVPLAALVALGARLAFDPAALLARAAAPGGASQSGPDALSGEALRLAVAFDTLPAGPARSALGALLAALPAALASASSAPQQT